MKAARIVSPYAVRVVEEAEPEVGPDDVLASVAYVGICGTDYSIYSGESSFLRTGQIRYPMRPGHEWSGVVYKVGAAVTDFKPGDRVVGDTSVSCGRCAFCMSGKFNLCPSTRCVGTVNTWDGAYAERMIMPSRHMYKVPDALALDEAALVEPAATALHAVRMGKVAPGDTVVVHGTGTIGLFAVQFAKACGASKVILTGVTDAKLSFGLRLGADIAIHAIKENVTETVLAHTEGLGADCVIEASGSLAAIAQVVLQAKPGATVSVVGIYEHPLERLDIDQLVFRQISLQGVNGSPGMFRPAMELMASGRVESRRLITHRYRFEEIEHAMKAMKSEEDTRVKIMLCVSEEIAKADEERRGTPCSTET